MSDKITLAKFLSPHGVKGLLKLESYTQNPEDIFHLSLLYCENDPVTIHHRGQGGAQNIFIVKADIATDRNQAEALTSKEIYTLREHLDETAPDIFYHTDLIGLEVRDINGDIIGEIVHIHNFGAGDIVEISLMASKLPKDSISASMRRKLHKNPDIKIEHMLMLTKESFPEIKPEQGRITVIFPEEIS